MWLIRDRLAQSTQLGLETRDLAPRFSDPADLDREGIGLTVDGDLL